MLYRTRQIDGLKVEAGDAVVGKAVDVLFDERHWMVRYVVVDLGHWLPGRRVLLSPAVVRDLDPQGRRLQVDVTAQQVESSPSLDTRRPVSRRQEADLAEHFGWPAYWTGMGYPGGLGPVPIEPPTRDDREAPPPEDESLLRSAGELHAYHIETNDGRIGHVEDLLIDDDSWQVRYVQVDTRNWWPGKKVLVPAKWTRSINWAQRIVDMDLDRETIANAPPYEPGLPVSASYQAELEEYYQEMKEI